MKFDNADVCTKLLATCVPWPSQLKYGYLNVKELVIVAFTVEVLKETRELMLALLILAIVSDTEYAFMELTARELTSARTTCAELMFAVLMLAKRLRVEMKLPVPFTSSTNRGELQLIPKLLT